MRNIFAFSFGGGEGVKRRNILKKIYKGGSA